MRYWFLLSFCPFFDLNFAVDFDFLKKSGDCRTTIFGTSMNLKFFILVWKIHCGFVSKIFLLSSWILTWIVLTIIKIPQKIPRRLEKFFAPTFCLNAYGNENLCIRDVHFFARISGVEIFADDAIWRLIFGLRFRLSIVRFWRALFLLPRLLKF